MELDLLDKKILFYFDFNTRNSLTKLAKRCNISKQTLSYRLSQLEKNNIISGYYTDINVSKLGISIYLVYLKFSYFDEKTEKNLISNLSKQSNLGVLTSLEGKWDFCIGIWAKNPVEFNGIFQKSIEGFENLIRDQTIMIETKFTYSKPKILFNENNFELVTMDQEFDSYGLDLINKKILESLSQNSRVSLVELSNKLDLTANAIKNRIKKLQRENIILSFRSEINYQALGFSHYRCFLHLENFEREERISFTNFLSSLSEITSVTETIGYCSLEFRGYFKNVEHFHKIINQIRKKVPNKIKEYEIVIYRKFHSTLNYFPYF